MSVWRTWWTTTNPVTRSVCRQILMDRLRIGWLWPYVGPHLLQFMARWRRLQYGARYDR